jgi:hypothetical protein
VTYSCGSPRSTSNSSGSFFSGAKIRIESSAAD